MLFNFDGFCVPGGGLCVALIICPMCKRFDQTPLMCNLCAIYVPPACRHLSKPPSSLPETNPHSVEPNPNPVGTRGTRLKVSPPPNLAADAPN